MAKSELFVRKQSGGMFTVVNEGITTGNIFFVDSGSATKADSVGSGNNPDKPFATLDFAVGQCTANNGDRIYVMPGHVETVTAAAGLDLDVAGISIIGIGNCNNRPKVTFTTSTSADMDVDAADICISNFLFDLNDIDALIAPLDINSSGFEMHNCRISMASSGGQAVLGILTEVGADIMTIQDCVFEASTDAGSTACIRLVGVDRPFIRNCKFYGDYSVGNISFLTTASTNVWIENNDFDNLNAVDVNIEGLAASTGSIRYNTCRNATDAQVTWINTTGAMQLFENYGVNNDGETGLLIGTASA